MRLNTKEIPAHSPAGYNVFGHHLRHITPAADQSEDREMSTECPGLIFRRKVEDTRLRIIWSGVLSDCLSLMMLSNN